MQTLEWRRVWSPGLATGLVNSVSLDGLMELIEFGKGIVTRAGIYITVW